MTSFLFVTSSLVFKKRFDTLGSNEPSQQSQGQWVLALPLFYR